jgi:TolB-like protein/tetratricopeptide (TPR) repeat protein
MSSLYEELKRRNVVRVALLYGAVAWVLIQIVDIVMPRLGIPEWGITLVIVLLGTGFPIALILAWAFELTPEGLKRTEEVSPDASIAPVTGQKINHLIIGLLCLALVVVVIDSYVLEDAEDTVAAPAAGATSAQSVVTPPEAPTLTSIAVLPFVNMSADPEQEYFADGVSEELLNLLAKVEDFRVVGRTSSFAFKGKHDDLRVIAEKLGVTTILEGSVRKDGEHIRVTAQLIKADDGYHLWSETYDRKLDSIFAIQDEIAGEVVTALKITLLDDGDAGSARPATVALARDKPTENMEAYTSYLRGQHMIRSRAGDDMFTALREFRHAVELDPDFAEAHVGVANGYTLLANYGYRNIDEVAPLAEASIDRALALNPDLGGAWAAKSLLEELRGATPEETLPLLKKAVSLNPNDAQSLAWLASDYGDANRFDDQFATLQKAYALDPLSAIIIFNMAIVSKENGLDDEATRLADELESLMPDKVPPYRLRASLAWHSSDFVAEIRWQHRALSINPGSVPTLVSLSDNVRDIGELEAAERFARKAREVSPSSIEAIEDLALALIYQGRTEEASSLVEQTLQRYPASRPMLSLEGRLAYAAGDYDEALARVRKAYPHLFADPIRIDDGNSLYWAHNLAWIYRLQGAVDKSDAMLAAMHRHAEARMRAYPSRGPDWLAARTAAVVNDREALERHLRNMMRIGPGFGHLLHDPMFLQYSDDPAIAAVFDDMRETDRAAGQQLAAEGIL